MITLRELADQIREVNIAHGWRDDDTSWDDLIALLHTEISECVGHWRVRRLASYVTATGKPDDVAAELADAVIRLLDMCDVHGEVAFDMDCELADVASRAPERELLTFGAWISWLHAQADRMWEHPGNAPIFLRAVVTAARRFHIDLEKAVLLKLEYNRTRPFQHGGTIGGSLP